MSKPKEMVLQPYEHDCPRCKWIGWGQDGKSLTNMYLCEQNDYKTLIIRYSNRPSNYRSYLVNGTASGLRLNADPDTIYNGKKLGARKKKKPTNYSGKNCL